MSLPNKPLISVIIPARNEWPNIIHTLYSIVHCLETDGFSPKDFEIILVDNCSDDREDPRTANSGTTNYVMPRSFYWSRVLRIIRDPVCGNHSARNKGAETALGKYLFFSDAHMAYRPGFFKTGLKTIEETGGMLHGAIGWMGAYPPHPSGIGYQYTIKLGEEIKGTWNNYCLDTEKWFYIPALGHCSVLVNKKQFMDFGGYPKVHRTYGGGEFYLDMKWWMFGSSVVVHPHAIAYHLASSRGYSYNHDDYIHNVFNIGLALGMDEWVERTYLNYMRRGRREVLNRLIAEARIETKSDRRFIEKKRKKTFNELIVERPWDKMNIERFGKCNGGLSIFHETWISLLRQAPKYVQDLYDNSQKQKDLEKFINENLSEFVYKRKR